MSQSQFSKTRFAPAAVNVTFLPRGGTVLRSPQPLQSYPRRMGDMLSHWAMQAPDRVFLAERNDSADRSGWRTITYAKTLAAVRSLAQALLDRKLSAERPVAILSGNTV